MCLAEGQLEARCADTELSLVENDTAVCPGWTWRQYRAVKDSFLFCASDRVVHEKLGLFREERG
jgi:gentisate 1,2-dioxygenase